ncbi:MAG TPA: ribosome silencing factor [Candidatus Acidoferrales bacterium]|nr:ribosome silencing factor [Candidatus Acidoferrales bacterium]
MMPELPSPRLASAAQAALDKKAAAITVLDLREMAAFTDFFLLCTGWSGPQVQAIADEMEKRMKDQGLRRPHREGYNAAEWVLLDYGEFVVHIFSEKARLYYDLERLWRSARRIEIPEPGAGHIATG